MSTTDHLWKDRIVATPEVCGGKTRVAGTRIPLDVILDNLAEGLKWEEIIEEYPQLTVEDIQATLHFVAYQEEHTQLKRIRFDTSLRDFFLNFGLSFFDKKQKTKNQYFKDIIDYEENIAGIISNYKEIITGDNVVEKTQQFIKLLSSSDELDLQEFILSILFLYYCAGEEPVASSTIGIYVKKYYRDSHQFLLSMENLESNELISIINKKFSLTSEGLNYAGIIMSRFYSHMK